MNFDGPIERMVETMQQKAVNIDNGTRCDSYRPDVETITEQYLKQSIL